MKVPLTLFDFETGRKTGTFSCTVSAGYDVTCYGLTVDRHRDNLFYARGLKNCWLFDIRTPDKPVRKFVTQDLRISDFAVPEFGAYDKLISVCDRSIYSYDVKSGQVLHEKEGTFSGCGSYGSVIVTAKYANVGLEYHDANTLEDLGKSEWNRGSSMVEPRCIQANRDGAYRLASGKLYFFPWTQ